MPLRSVYCIVTSRGRADSIIVDLRDDGFTSSEISVLFLDPDTSPHMPESPELVHASTGAIRGVIASITGIQRLVIPGLGPVIASGGFAHGQSGEGPKAILDMLARFGVPEAEAARYAGRILAGHFLIAIQTLHSGAGDRAREIFTAGKADDICTKLDIAPSKLESSKAAAIRRAAAV